MAAFDGKNKEKLEDDFAVFQQDIFNEIWKVLASRKAKNHVLEKNMDGLTKDEIIGFIFEDKQITMQELSYMAAALNCKLDIKFIPLESQENERI